MIDTLGVLDDGELGDLAVELGFLVSRLGFLGRDLLVDQLIFSEAESSSQTICPFLTFVPSGGS